jgi:hypothetical protein
MRIVNGRAICAGDCPMFQVTGQKGKGWWLLKNLPCSVGQLCHEPVVSGGTRYPFGRFSTSAKYHPKIGSTATRGPKLKAAQAGA